MPQIHKFIAKGKVAHYFVSQWNADISLAGLYSRFKAESVAAGIDPNSDEFLGFMMEDEHLFYAGSGDLGLLSKQDEFELPL